MLNKSPLTKDFIKKYQQSGLRFNLPIYLGIDDKDIDQFADLVNLKHILMTGSTGSGKSVFEHNIISAFLKLFPHEQLNFFLIDMKLVEFPYAYKDLPHLLSPVTTNPGKAFIGLEWVRFEKDSRLKRTKSELGKLPYIVVIIDTFSDLMLYDDKRFQKLIKETLDKAAEVKIHFIMCDSRPSPDVFTPLIKNSFPTKICFNVTSAADSKMVINTPGGEKLLGKGDLLLLRENQKRPVHLQAPFISDDEIKNIVKRAKKHKREIFNFS